MPFGIRIISSHARNYNKMWRVSIKVLKKKVVMVQNVNSKNELWGVFHQKHKQTDMYIPTQNCWFS